jgi:hypothetical protein
MKTSYQYKFVDATLTMHRFISMVEIAEGLDMAVSSATAVWAQYNFLNTQPAIGYKYKKGVEVTADFEPMYPELNAPEFLHACKTVFTAQPESERVLKVRDKRSASSRRSNARSKNVR